MKKLLRSIGIINILLFFSVPVVAEEAAEYDTAAPDKDYVWVDGYEDANGDAVNGFYRERARDGFAWVDGHYDVLEDWVEPHWAPTHLEAGNTWVKGHVGPDGYWVPGHRRAVKRVGYHWVAPAIVAGVLIHGH